MVRHLLTNVVNADTAASDSSELFAENSVELLGNDAGLLEVLKDNNHVDGLVEELLKLGEVPSGDGQLVFDLRASPGELRFPALKDLGTSLDVSNCLGRFDGLFENSPDIDLQPDLLADLIRDSLQDVLKLFDVVVDVAGNSPDKF